MKWGILVVVLSVLFLVPTLAWAPPPVDVGPPVPPNEIFQRTDVFNSEGSGALVSFEIPEGKRLVVQNISVRVISRTQNGLEMVYAKSLTEEPYGWLQRGELYLPFTSIENADGGYEFVFCGPVTLYVDYPDTLIVSALHASNSNIWPWTMYVSVVGFLETI